MDKKSKIFLAGHKGLVGSAVYDCLKENNYKNITVNRLHDNGSSKSRWYSRK